MDSKNDKSFEEHLQTIHDIVSDGNITAPDMRIQWTKAMKDMRGDWLNEGMIIREEEFGLKDPIDKQADKLFPVPDDACAINSSSLKM